MKAYTKACLIVGGFLILLGSALSFADAHAADLSKVHVKGMPAPKTYRVNGKEVNAAEATLALLNGGSAEQCTQMELEASNKGLNIKPKKSQ